MSKFKKKTDITYIIETPSVCRVCLKTGCGFVSARRFEAEFKDLVGIVISPFDGLPQALCPICIALLQKFTAFKRKIIKSQNSLRQHVDLRIPLACNEMTPHLSWTPIMYDGFPSAQAEQLEEQVNAPVNISVFVAKIEGAQEEEFIVPDFEYNITQQKCSYESSQINVANRISGAIDKPKVYYVMASNSGVQKEQFGFDEHTNSGQEEVKIYTVFDKTGAPAIKKTRNTDISEDNLGVSFREIAGLVSQGRVAEDTTTREVSESEQVTIKRKETKCSNDVTGRDEFLDNDEKLAHCDELDNSSRNSTDKLNNSDVCMKCFSRKHDCLNTHKRKRTGGRPFKCAVCQKCFTEYSSLIEHYRNHVAEKSYKCGVCMKCFTDRTALRKHSRIHFRRIAYKCDVCMKDFNRKHDFIRHYRIHTGEKPYNCDVCMKAFRQKINLVTHLRTHR